MTRVTLGTRSGIFICSMGAWWTNRLTWPRRMSADGSRYEVRCNADGAVRNMERAYPQGPSTAYVLRRVTLDIRAGEFVSIMAVRCRQIDAPPRARDARWRLDGRLRL